MTERELRRLSRADLLEMMIKLSNENKQLREELEMTKERLQQRRITIEESGSIAEAALRLSGIFEAAQMAADRYLENLRLKYEDDPDEKETDHRTTSGGDAGEGTPA